MGKYCRCVNWALLEVNFSCDKTIQLGKGPGSITYYYFFHVTFCEILYENWADCSLCSVSIPIVFSVSRPISLGVGGPRAQVLKVWEGPWPKFSRCGRAHVLSPKHAYLGMKWRARSLENSNFGLQNKNVNIFFNIYSNQISCKTNNFLYHKHACFGLRRWSRGKPLTSARSSFFTDFASPPPTQDSSWFCTIFYYNYDSLKNKLII